MIGIIQRIFQLLFIGALIFIAIKPTIVPSPLQPFSTAFSQFVIGDTISFSSFIQTWTNHWQTLVSFMPQLRNMKAPWPEPPDPITGDWILEVMKSKLIEGPLDKWKQLGQTMTLAPVDIATESGTSTP